MKRLEEFSKFISTEPKKIVITTHANADADALGSSLALYDLLSEFSHDVNIILPNHIPDYLSWMRGDSSIYIFDSDEIETCRSLINSSEVIFCLDFPALARLKKMEETVRICKATKILIDHHLNPETFAHLTLSDISAAATAEIIFELIRKSDFEDFITPRMANMIFAGILTDTGSFKHPSTTSKIHRIAADLIDKGANSSLINTYIYDNNSVDRLRFMGNAFLNRMVVKKDLRIAYFIIYKEDFENFRLKSGDTEGLVNYALSIHGIEVASILLELPNEVKLSFRSSGEYSVNTFASKYFNGGGHKNASGGCSDLSIQATIVKFETLIKDFVFFQKL